MRKNALFPTGPGGGQFHLTTFIALTETQEFELLPNKWLLPNAKAAVPAKKFNYFFSVALAGATEPGVSGVSAADGAVPKMSVTTDVYHPTLSL